MTGDMTGGMPGGMTDGMGDGMGGGGGAAGGSHPFFDSPAGGGGWTAPPPVPAVPPPIPPPVAPAATGGGAAAGGEATQAAPSLGACVGRKGVCVDTLLGSNGGCLSPLIDTPGVCGVAAPTVKCCPPLACDGGVVGYCVNTGSTAHASVYPIFAGGGGAAMTTSGGVVVSARGALVAAEGGGMPSSCDGKLLPGLCGGPAAMKCCKDDKCSLTPPGASAPVTGTCVDASRFACKATPTYGPCASATAYCCVGGPTARRPPPPPTPALADPLPPGPLGQGTAACAAVGGAGDAASWGGGYWAGAKVTHSLTTPKLAPLPAGGVVHAYRCARDKTATAAASEASILSRGGVVASVGEHHHPRWGEATVATSCVVDAVDVFVIYTLSARVVHTLKCSKGCGRAIAPVREEVEVVVKVKVASLDAAAWLSPSCAAAPAAASVSAKTQRRGGGTLDVKAHDAEGGSANVSIFEEGSSLGPSARSARVAAVGGDAVPVVGNLATRYQCRMAQLMQRTDFASTAVGVEQKVAAILSSQRGILRLLKRLYGPCGGANKVSVGDVCKRGYADINPGRRVSTVVTAEAEGTDVSFVPVSDPCSASLGFASPSSGAGGGGSAAGGSLAAAAAAAATGADTAGRVRLASVSSWKGSEEGVEKGGASVGVGSEAVRVGDGDEEDTGPLLLQAGEVAAGAMEEERWWNGLTFGEASQRSVATGSIAHATDDEDVVNVSVVSSASPPYHVRGGRGGVTAQSSAAVPTLPMSSVGKTAGGGKRLHGGMLFEADGVAACEKVVGGGAASAPMCAVSPTPSAVPTGRARGGVAASAGTLCGCTVHSGGGEIWTLALGGLGGLDDGAELDDGGYERLVKLVGGTTTSVTPMATGSVPVGMLPSLRSSIEATYAHLSLTPPPLHSPIRIITLSVAGGAVASRAALAAQTAVAAAGAVGGGGPLSPTALLAAGVIGFTRKANEAVVANPAAPPAGKPATLFTEAEGTVAAAAASSGGTGSDGSGIVGGDTEVASALIAPVSPEAVQLAKETIGGFVTGPAPSPDGGWGGTLVGGGGLSPSGVPSPSGVGELLDEYADALVEEEDSGGGVVESAAIIGVVGAVAALLSCVGLTAFCGALGFVVYKRAVKDKDVDDDDGEAELQRQVEEYDEERLGVVLGVHGAEAAAPMSTRPDATVEELLGEELLQGSERGGGSAEEGDGDDEGDDPSNSVE